MTDVCFFKITVFTSVKIQEVFILKKKIIIAAAAVALSLSACSSKSEPVSSTQNSEPAQTQGQQDSEEPAEQAPEDTDLEDSQSEPSPDDSGLEALPDESVSDNNAEAGLAGVYTSSGGVWEITPLEGMQAMPGGSDDMAIFTSENTVLNVIHVDNSDGNSPASIPQTEEDFNTYMSSSMPETEIELESFETIEKNSLAGCRAMFRILNDEDGMNYGIMEFAADNSESYSVTAVTTHNSENEINKILSSIDTFSIK